MTDKPDIQAAQGSYRVDGDWICAHDGDGIAIALETARYVKLDKGHEWDRTVEPYADYLKRIEPELEREREIRRTTARLLAASWDLLEAAKATLSGLDAEFGQRVTDVNFPLLRAAIAKATVP